MAIAIPMRITASLSMVFLLGATQSCPEETEAPTTFLQEAVKVHKTTQSRQRTFSAEDQAAFKQYLRVEGEGEKMTPLMTQEEIHFLRQELAKADAFLEFGMGGSTAIALTFPNIHCYKGIESSQLWIDRVSKEESIAKAIEQGIAELKYVDIGKTLVGGFKYVLAWCSMVFGLVDRLTENFRGLESGNQDNPFGVSRRQHQLRTVAQVLQ